MTYSARNQEPVLGAFGNNFAGFGPIAVPTRDFPGSSLYFNHNRNSFFKSGVFWPKTAGFWPKILKSLKIGPPTPTHNKHFRYVPPRTKRKEAHHPKLLCEEITMQPGFKFQWSNSTHYVLSPEGKIQTLSWAPESALDAVFASTRFSWPK